MLRKIFSSVGEIVSAVTRPIYENLEGFSKDLTMLAANFVTNDGNRALDIAISEEGKADLLAALRKAFVEGTRQALNEDEDWQAALDFIWKGEDKDQFVANFNKQKEETMREVQNYYEQLEKVLNQADEAWADFRSSNVSAR